MRLKLYLGKGCQMVTFCFLIKILIFIFPSFFFFLVRGLKGKRPQGLLKNINETRAGLFHIPTIL